MACFDMEKTLAAFGNDQEIFDSVAEEFVAQLPSEIEKLKTAIESGDLDTTRITSHTLKGLAGSFYAETAKAIALEIETSAKNSDLNGASEKLSVFIESFEQLKTEVQSALNK